MAAKQRCLTHALHGVLGKFIGLFLDHQGVLGKRETYFTIYLLISVNRGFREALFYHQAPPDAESQAKSCYPVTFLIK